jgi:hypothetical protein
MSRRRPSTIAAVTVLLALALGACAESADDSASDFDEVGAPISAEGWSEDAPADGDDGIYLETEDGVSAPPSSLAPVAGAVGDERLESASLDLPSAGSVDDNELWDEYLRYRDEFFPKGIPVSDLPVDGRQLLTVVDVDGDPVLGAHVRILDGSGGEVARLRTYADGRAVFLGSTTVDPDTQSRPAYQAVVAAGATEATFDLDPAALTHTLALDADLPSPAEVDVLFLVDATGSMGDEIERLKASMISVSEQIAALPSAPSARFSMVVYRDRGEEYLTRTFDFTDDVQAFTAALSEVVADGGGDTPEALGSGLDDAVHGVSWREEGAVKLVFLLADAAPHLAGEPGYEDEPDYATVLRDAAASGIKVFPIASSGLDDQGEFVFRQLAQVTLGRFVFLTYGIDGASPGTSTPHDVDPEDYDVLALDALVVQLVGDELAGLPR